VSHRSPGYSQVPAVGRRDAIHLHHGSLELEVAHVHEISFGTVVLVVTAASRILTSSTENEAWQTPYHGAWNPTELLGFETTEFTREEYRELVKDVEQNMANLPDF